MYVLNTKISTNVMCNILLMLTSVHAEGPRLVRIVYFSNNKTDKDHFFLYFRGFKECIGVATSLGLNH